MVYNLKYSLYMEWLIMEKEVKAILDNVSVFSNIYDMVRIIDPIAKKIVYCYKKEDKKLESKCYSFWKKGESCDNCISMRTINESKTFVKIEYSKDNKIYMITSSMIKHGNKKFVIELVKDIMGTGIIEDVENATECEIYDYIKEKNNRIIKDPLTEVYNKLFIKERLPVDLFNAKLNNIPLSIMLIDIDYFKEINDTYGHIAGDFVLKQFSKQCRELIKEYDGWMSRYGGDEFLIALRDVDRKKVLKISKEIISKTREWTLCYKNSCIRMSISIGIYIYEGENIDYVELIDRADKNMYNAKEMGRDRIVSN
ncbi:GGDEF domain-containing protein [Clostridium tetani]|uniref:Response regulator protein n=3 Tax=Clostridium tetani TaxID=1513 RepID=Q892V3_CLOTE|nr:response regulator protein [Clostridium tetani E88]QBD85401.1 GGDEF domain-containing protein [Clostridium tetani]QBD87757.1 GGDEF domain-containing protein [Clostridium tetani]RXI61700.1 GGDEF domain-containing protein [Clostridium tetani]RXI64391.1 GGDEF domain-containing protein [Clostridium tetani]